MSRSTKSNPDRMKSTKSNKSVAMESIAESTTVGEFNNYIPSEEVQEIMRKAKQNKDGLHVVDGEILHDWWVKEEIRQSLLEGNVREKENRYIKKRLEDKLFRDVAQSKDLGGFGRMSQVTVAAHDYSWRQTTKPFGPANQRAAQQELRRQEEEELRRFIAMPSAEELQDYKAKEEWYAQR